MSENTYILSVCIRTYNQERFVSEALDSVLKQRTLFPFEIIVSDDCSKDGTRDVLREYQTKFPDSIRLIFGDRNIGGPNNLRRVIEASQAKYIVCLDGDDFFTDTYKLQKQIDFLEEHSEYVACFHNVMNIYETGNKSLFLPLDFPSKVEASDVISKRWFLPIHSVMMRRKLISFPEWYSEVMNDDYVVNLSVVMHGPYYYLPDVMAVYRHHSANTSIQYQNVVLIDSQLSRILEGFVSIYPESYKAVFETRIKELKEEMEYCEGEMKHPWRKWFRLKTYKKIIKRIFFER